MNDPLDVDQLLRELAPTDDIGPEPSINRLVARVLRATPRFGRRSQVIVIAYSVIALSVCLTAMLGLSYSWWLIGGSLGGSLLVTLIGWFGVRSLV